MIFVVGCCWGSFQYSSLVTAEGVTDLRVFDCIWCSNGIITHAGLYCCCTQGNGTDELPLKEESRTGTTETQDLEEEVEEDEERQAGCDTTDAKTHHVR